MEWLLGVVRPHALGGFTARFASSENVEHDGLGNQISSVYSSSMVYSGCSTSNSKTQNYRYDVSGRLVETPKMYQADTILYDRAGNEVFHKEWAPVPEAAAHFRDRASFYSADGKLRASETRDIASGDPMAAGIYTRVFEEFRYDALGRRIWSRSRNWCERDPEDWEGLCRQSKVRRMVWDGDDESYEIQMPDPED